MRIVPFILASWLSLIALGAQAEGDKPLAQIIVIGAGSATAVPDQASIHLGVRQYSENAAEAMAMANGTVSAVLEKLKAQGIEPRDMQTSSLRLNPVWDNKKRYDGERAGPSGFEATNDIRVLSRDLDALGTLLDLVVSEGANTFSSLQFGVQDREPLLAEARSAAMADAVRKAEQYAVDAGIELGEVLLVTEDLSHDVGYNAPVAEMAMSRAGGVPIAQGEIEVNAQIKVIFAAHSGS